MYKIKVFQYVYKNREHHNQESLGAFRVGIQKYYKNTLQIISSCYYEPSEWISLDSTESTTGQKQYLLSCDTTMTYDLVFPNNLSVNFMLIDVNSLHLYVENLWWLFNFSLHLQVETQTLLTPLVLFHKINYLSIMNLHNTWFLKKKKTTIYLISSVFPLCLAVSYYGELVHARDVDSTVSIAESFWLNQPVRSLYMSGGIMATSLNTGFHVGGLEEVLFRFQQFVQVCFHNERRQERKN